MNRIAENSSDYKSDILSARSGLFLFRFGIVLDFAKDRIFSNCVKIVEGSRVWIVGNQSFNSSAFGSLG